MAHPANRAQRAPWLCVPAELLLWCLLAAWQIWGTSGALRDQLPLGTESSATVPLFNAWTLAWNATQAAGGFRSYFHAPIFYPQPGAFTFSEMQPTMLVVAPVIWWGGSPALAYNLYLCLSLALSATMARRLARSLGYSIALSLLAALLVFHLPLARWQLGVIQLTAVWGPLAVMLASVHLARRPSGRRAIILGTALAACYAACNYYGLFVLLLAPVFLLLLYPADASGAAASAGSRRSGTERPHALSRIATACGPLAHLPLALVTAATLTSPMLFGQFRYLATLGSARPVAWVESFSARPVDYLYTWPDRADLLGDRPIGEPAIRPLGCGLVTTAAAVLALALLLGATVRRALAAHARHEPLITGGPTSGAQASTDAEVSNAATKSQKLAPRCPRPDRWLWFCGLLALVSLAVSLGPRLSVAGFEPWESLSLWLPPIRLVRTPYRMAVLYQIAIVFLAIEAWRWAGCKARAIAICGDTQHRLSRWRLTAFISISLLITLSAAVAVLESWPRNSPLYDLSQLRSEPDWSRWLRENSEPHGAVAMLPMPRDGSTSQYESTSLWMLQALRFKRPLINGYSGFFPPAYRQIRVAMSDFPAGDALVQLHLSGCRYLVIDSIKLDAGAEQLVERMKQADAPEQIAPRLVFEDPVAAVTIWRLGQ